MCNGLVLFMFQFILIVRFLFVRPNSSFIIQYGIKPNPFSRKHEEVVVEEIRRS